MYWRVEFACNAPIKIFGPLKNSFRTTCALMKNDICHTTTELMNAISPPMMKDAMLPASISKSPPLVLCQMRNSMGSAVYRRLTTTFITLLFNFAVVINHAIKPAANPIREPEMQPHLFAFFQVIHNAIGITPEPRITPINV